MLFFGRSIKTRLYGGYAMMMLLIMALVGFGSWQLSEIKTDVGMMKSLSDNSVRVLQIGANLQAIQRAMLRFNFDADEAAFKESAEREDNSIELLKASASTTMSSERKQIYTSLQESIGQIRKLRETLGDAVRAKTAAMKLLFTAGDDLAENVTNLVDAAQDAAISPPTLRDLGELQTDALLVRIANWRFLATRDAKGVATFESNLNRAMQKIAALEKASIPPNLANLMDSTKTALNGYAAAFEDASTNILKGDEIYRGDLAKVTVQTTQDLAKAKDSLQQDFLASETKAIDGIAQTMNAQQWAAGLALVLAGVLAALIARSILPPLVGMTNAMTALASGNHEIHIPGQQSRDEIGKMAKALAIFQSAAIENAQLEREASQQRARAELERSRSAQVQQEAIERERAIVAETIGVGLARLASKELTFRMTSEIPPAYRKLQSDFNQAVAELEQAMKSLAGSAGAIHSGTHEISAASDDLSRRTEQQAASLEETAAALDEITATVRKSAESAKHAREIVGNADGDAKKGAVVVRQAVEAMEAISKSSGQIGQIIGVIDEIAFQTNLLALNAGVEAARAGEAGRGFAVVASEVRALAQRSADAAKEIKGLISNSTTQVDNGVRLVAETGKALERIIAQVTEINTVVADIAAGAQEQAVGLQQVNSAINQMDQATQQNATMVEESTAASHSLSQETTQLSGLVGQFQVGGGSSGPDVRRAPAAPRPAQKPAHRAA